MNSLPQLTKKSKKRVIREMNDYLPNAHSERKTVVGKGELSRDLPMVICADYDGRVAAINEMIGVKAPIFIVSITGDALRSASYRQEVRLTKTMPLTNIFLVGPMGAGKSTIGRMLARELRLPFFDSDHEVEARCGADIPWIFDVEGEEGFRQRETQVIQEFCSRRGIVLATGGGAITQLENRQHLGTNGFVVFLKASVVAQLARTGKDKKRPLLQRPDREEVLTQLLGDRAPLYSSIADIELDTERLSPKALINEIIWAVGRL